MANKARYYGIATKEQQDLKARASRSPVINKQELTEWTVYSALRQIPNADKLSTSILVSRLKDIIEASNVGYNLTASNSKISDGVNSFWLTKTKSGGFQIGKQEHDDTKRKK